MATLGCQAILGYLWLENIPRITNLYDLANIIISGVGCLDLFLIGQPLLDRKNHIKPSGKIESSTCKVSGPFIDKQIPRSERNLYFGPMPTYVDGDNNGIATRNIR